MGQSYLLVVDESIAEDAVDFVDPEPQESLLWVLVIFVAA